MYEILSRWNSVSKFVAKSSKADLIAYNFFKLLDMLFYFIFASKEYLIEIYGGNE